MTPRLADAGSISRVAVNSARSRPRTLGKAPPAAVGVISSSPSTSPHWGPERRRRYSRLAVWVGSGLGSPLAGDVLGPDATAPARTLRMEVDDKELGSPPPAVAAARVGPRTPPPAQHRELVAQDEDLQIPGGVAAGERASSWMKRRRQVGGSRQLLVALSWGVGSRDRTACRCGPAAHRPRPSFSAPYRRVGGVSEQPDSSRKQIHAPCLAAPL